MTADHFGRPPLPRIPPQSVLDLRAKAEALAVQSNAPKPILMGRHLIELGMQPGPEFKSILEAAYDAQLEGDITDPADAMRWLSRFTKTGG
jgi:tRNA nucleotidyltransferase (CCA-adding enzyme)